MKFIKSHREFAERVNDKLDLNIPKKDFEELDKLDEAFQNDVTLSNSLIGQLFGWVFNKIGARIKKGQMKALLEELANEFGKGQYAAVKGKEIAKKNAVYSNIIGLKNFVNNDNISDEKFQKEFKNKLNEVLEEYRELIEGKGEQRIDNENLRKVAKDFYEKLNKLSSSPVELKQEISPEDEQEENLEDEMDLNPGSLDESLKPNTNLFEMLDIAGDSKLEVIANNIENQIGKEVIIGENILRIEESMLSFEEIDRYFDALNISVELINDSIIIENYDKYLALYEYNSENKYAFIYELKDAAELILDANIKGGKIRGFAVSKDSDYENFGDLVYDTIFGTIKKNNLNIKKYKGAVKRFDNKNLTIAYEKTLKYLEKFKHSKANASGFKSNYSNLIRALEELEGITKSLASQKHAEYSKALKKEEEETAVIGGEEMSMDNKGRIDANDKTFKKLANTPIEYKDKKGQTKVAKIKGDQDSDVDEEIGMIQVIGLKNNVYPIDGDKITKIGGEIKDGRLVGGTEINGILNRGHKEERKRRKTEIEDWEKNVQDLSWYLDKDIEYEKDGKIKKAHVLPKEEQLKEKGIVGGLRVKSPDVKDDEGNVVKPGRVYFLNDIESKVQSLDGKEYDSESMLVDREYIQDRLDNLFPNDSEYEKELILNERDKKDLLNTIKHKAGNEATLINPLQVMKIFNKAHNKYTVEDYESIPDGKQGSSLQGKGKGTNKKKHFKKMPDGSGRQVKLFKQWNEGVIDLLEQYGDYIPDALKKFIITVLNDNTIYGKGGAQAKLLQDYFNIKVDKEDLGIGEGGITSSKKTKKSTKTDIYVETKDTNGVFKTPESNSLQLKKENFENVPFIIEGNQKGESPTTYVCYYLGTVNNLVLFKFKTNNIDFLNNYKRQEQTIEEPDDMKGNIGDEVMYGAFPIPRGANKSLSAGDDMPIYFTDVSLDEEVKGPGIFGIDKVQYLQGEDDGGVMRLDTKNPASAYGDAQNEFKQVQKKFDGIKA